jgi:hypothetical protein
VTPLGNEVIDRGESIYEKIISLDLSKFTFMDIIYIAGVITLFILAIKVVGKFLKFILVILAILLLLYWLSTLGIFST